MSHDRWIHVSICPWSRGSIIQPGHWGRSARKFCPGGRSLNFHDDALIFSWEIALETARIAYAPSKPSRFDSVFLSANIESAQSFKDQYQKAGRLYEVAMCDPHASFHIGSWDLILSDIERPYVDVLPLLAREYWLSTPRGHREIVVGGSVMIEREIT